MVKIKNVIGTAGETCNCDSWLEHWEKHGGGKAPSYCPVISCYNTNIVGAHVRKVGDSTIYIFPLCKEHNQSSGEISVSDNWKFVIADKASTCGKR